MGGGRTRDYAIECRIVKLARNEICAPHLIKMGHEITDRRDEGVGIIDFDSIHPAGIPIYQVSSGERQLAEPRLPSGGAIGIGR